MATGSLAMIQFMIIGGFISSVFGGRIRNVTYFAILGVIRGLWSFIWGCYWVIIRIEYLKMIFRKGWCKVKRAIMGSGFVGLILSTIIFFSGVCVRQVSARDEVSGQMAESRGGTRLILKVGDRPAVLGMNRETIGILMESSAVAGAAAGAAGVSSERANELFSLKALESQEQGYFGFELLVSKGEGTAGDKAGEFAGALVKNLEAVLRAEYARSRERLEQEHAEAMKTCAEAGAAYEAAVAAMRRVSPGEALSQKELESRRARIAEETRGLQNEAEQIRSQIAGMYRRIEDLHSAIRVRMTRDEILAELNRIVALSELQAVRFNDPAYREYDRIEIHKRLSAARVDAAARQEQIRMEYGGREIEVLQGAITEHKAEARTGQERLEALSAELRQVQEQLSRAPEYEKHKLHTAAARKAYQEALEHKNALAERLRTFPEVYVSVIGL